MTEQEMDALLESFADACYDVGFAHGANHGIAEVEESRREKRYAALRKAIMQLRAQLHDAGLPDEPPTHTTNIPHPWGHL